MRVKCLLDGKLPTGRKPFHSGNGSFIILDGKFAVHHSHSAATQRASSLYVVFIIVKKERISL